ncbi:hypothetical protein D9757_001340 [Collybiopsis confluens]|uniref:RRM domain-containing protein n=1 Tax=Collybiopsis confluens TaxID=2823264 RepID=A0A8H5I135_9AGAR|nr:hypothetical protein D9757_001340 [Collybiopsis confluens]
MRSFNKSDLTNTTNAFIKSHIVPDVLSSFSPAALLTVEFTDSATSQTLNVTPGIVLTMEQTTNEPQFFLTANVTIPSTISYVLAMLDPDAPTPQNTSISQYRHFLGGGFHVDNSSRLVNNTAALPQSEFVNPTPPAGSDPHRYVILAFIEPQDFQSNAQKLVNDSTPRTNFNLTTFANAVNLGSPIGGTYFLTGFSNSSNGTASSNSSSGSPSSSSSSAAGGSIEAYSAGLKATWGLSLCMTIYALRYTVKDSEQLERRSGILFGIGNAHCARACRAAKRDAVSLLSAISAMASRPTSKLPTGANRILFVKNLNYTINGEDLYDLFGRYGSIRQIRIGNEAKTKGTAFVVFEDVMDAKNALDHLNGFHLQERYIVVLYHMPAKQDAAAAKADLARREEELAQLKKKHNIDDD